MRIALCLSCLAMLALGGGCLSETLIDNYDTTKLASGQGGTAGDNSVLVRTSSAEPPRFITATGSGGTVGTSVVGAGGATGTASTALGGGPVASGGADASAGTSSAAGQAGSATIVYAVSNEQLRLKRYLRFDATTPNVRFGVTSTDHLVAVLSTAGVISGSDGSSDWETAATMAMLEATSSGDILRYRKSSLGRMPDVLAIQPNGTVVLAGKLDRDVNFGGPIIGKAEHGYFIVKLDANWQQVSGFGVSTDRDFILDDIACDDAGVIHLAMREDTLPTDSQAFYLAGFEADGTERYRWSVSSTRAIVADGNGRLSSAGSIQGERAIGNLTVGSVGLNDGLLMSFDTTNGSANVIGQFGSTGDDYANGIAALPNGHIRIGGELGSPSIVFGTHLDGSSLGTPFVADVDASSHTTWISALGGSGTVTDLVQVGELTYVAGYLLGPSSSWLVGDASLYVAEIGADGAVRSLFTIRAMGGDAPQLAVDSQRNVWLSGKAFVVPTKGGTETYSSVILQLVPSTSG